MTDAEFARLTGLSKAMVSLIKHRPPTNLPDTVNVRQWAKLLRLTDEEQAALLEAAELAWSPAGIRDLVRKMRAKEKPRAPKG